MGGSGVPLLCVVCEDFTIDLDKFNALAEILGMCGMCQKGKRKQ